MIDKEKVEAGVRLILEGIGEDVNREGLLETPDRIARMYEEIFGGMDMDAAEPLKKRFHASNNEMVVEKDITFYSMCEHHLVPFFGRVSIAYKPQGGMVAGFGKFTKLVDMVSHRPQLQERMTEQLAEAVMDGLQAEGVLVVAEAQQLCMTMRGDLANGTSTITSACRGCFDNDSSMYSQAWNLLGWNKGE